MPVPDNTLQMDFQLSPIVETGNSEPQVDLMSDDSAMIEELSIPGELPVEESLSYTPVMLATIIEEKSQAVISPTIESN